MAGNGKCWSCHGQRWYPVRVVECEALDNGHMFCDEHLQHYEWTERCWWCFGSGKAGWPVEVWWWVKTKFGRGAS